MIQCWLRAINLLLFSKPSGLKFYLIIFISVFIVSCKNSDSDLGLNLRPDKGEFYSAETDTFTVIAYTVEEDSIKTDSLSTNILGAMYDPQFGISTSGIATEATITQANISFGTTPKVDSVILYIRWDKAYAYGNTKSKQNMKIYTINEKIDDSKKYFSNYKPSLGSEIGNWTGNFNITDSIKLKQGKTIVKKGPGLLIKLNTSFGELLAKADPTVYSGVPTFKEFLKGIVFEPSKLGLTSGEGAILGADFFSGNSQIIVYYNDTLQHAFVFNNNCENYNLYTTDNNNTNIINQLAKPGMHYPSTYVQSMGGCKTKIEIPYLFNLIKNTVNERVIINEAALVLTPLNGTITTQYPLPNRLYLLQPDEKTKENAPILDFLDFLDPGFGRYSLYGGGYNSLTGDYTIRFTRHLQNILDQKNENLNRGFYVTIPSDKPITPSRVVLNTTRTSSNKALKLRITYSKIKT
jgi:hypothetical protein